MPYEVFPAPTRREIGASSRSLATRISTRLHRAGLDRELANGADPAGSDELRLRAEQLSSPAERTRIANAWVEALGDAHGRAPMTFRARPQLEVIRAADEIMELVLRLRDEQPVGVRGVAMAARLVDDRLGPLYRRDAGDIDQAVASAYAALVATRPVASEPPARAA